MTVLAMNVSVVLALAPCPSAPAFFAMGGTRQLRRQIELAIQSSRESHTFLDRDCASAKIAADSRPGDEPHRALRNHVSFESSGDGHTVGFDGVALDAGAGCHSEVADDDDIAFDVTLDDEGAVAVDATANASAPSDAGLPNVAATALAAWLRHDGDAT
jgi:hypothetical protein